MPARSFSSVIDAFLDSPKFDGLRAGTRINYTIYLRQAAAVMGTIAADEMHPEFVQAFLDGYADRPAAQKTAQTALKSLEAWAIVRRLLPPTRITLGTEAPGSKGGHKPWTDEQVAYAQEHVRSDLARVIVLMANTGQRGSDIVKMRWSDLETYFGRQGVNVTQKKTGLELWIPLTQELAAAFVSWERKPTFIALKTDGSPWTRKKLSDAWIVERSKHAPLTQLRLHGLRASAVVRLRRAGATLPQISDMVGMSSEMVARYCRLSIQKENAMAAVLNLDTVRDRQKALKNQRAD